MTWWRRLLRLDALPGWQGEARPPTSRAQQAAAEARVDDQRDKLRETIRDVVPEAYRAVDRLGVEVEKALRSIR